MTAYFSLINEVHKLASCTETTLTKTGYLYRLLIRNQGIEKVKSFECDHRLRRFNKLTKKAQIRKSMGSASNIPDRLNSD